MRTTENEIPLVSLYGERLRLNPDNVSEKELIMSFISKELAALDARQTDKIISFYSGKKRLTGSFL